MRRPGDPSIPRNALTGPAAASKNAPPMATTAPSARKIVRAKPVAGRDWFVGAMYGVAMQVILSFWVYDDTKLGRAGDTIQ